VGATHLKTHTCTSRKIRENKSQTTKLLNIASKEYERAGKKKEERKHARKEKENMLERNKRIKKLCNILLILLRLGCM